MILHLLWLAAITYMRANWRTRTDCRERWGDIHSISAALGYPEIPWMDGRL